MCVYTCVCIVCVCVCVCVCERERERERTTVTNKTMCVCVHVCVCACACAWVLTITKRYASESLRSGNQDPFYIYIYANAVFNHPYLLAASDQSITCYVFCFIEYIDKTVVMGNCYNYYQYQNHAFLVTERVSCQ